MSINVSQLTKLAQQSLQNQTEAEAELILGEWLTVHDREPIVLHWRALLLRALDRRREALALLNQAAALLPNSPVIALAIAQISFEAGLPSSRFYEAALRLIPTSGEARLGLVAAYFAEGRGEQAQALLSGALTSNPGWREGYRQYAQLTTLLGKAEQALTLLLQAIDRFPDALPLQIDALEMLLAAGDYAAVVDLSDRSAQPLGQVPQVMLRKATALDELGRTAEAEALFEVCGEPDDVIHATRKIRHLLRRGRPQAALDLAQPWLKSDQAGDIWPYVSLAWRMVDDPRIDWLEAQPGLVGIYDLEAHAVDWPALVARLRKIHATSGQFSNQSVNGGTQTDGPLFARIEPEIAMTRQVMVKVLQEHLAGLPPGDPSHPQLALRRDRPVRFSGSWSVRLKGQGFHRFHHHPQGWFSAVLYVAVPEGLQCTDGQLALGGSPPELGLLINPQRHVEPKQGRLVVFPSTMWHATESFCEGERMTIAFDLAPPFEETRQ